jgi:iron(III) transport system ATP-binding protein
MLEIEDLKKIYSNDDGTAGGGVFGVSLTIKRGEMFTLLGPSGCGKTTTLRSIAGLETPDSGRITLSGQDIYRFETKTSVPMHRRDIGMVFQSYAIWPHMTVSENAAYPLKTRRPRLSKEAVAEKVAKTLDMVGLSEFRDRAATRLSGGQQQRLALARALTREPSLLLMDEPLSNLDAQLREQMRTELLRLQRESGLTSIYVTHDQVEALALSDRIAVMNKGLIVQIGTPVEIYDRPATAFVASFIGRSSFIAGDLKAPSDAKGMATVDSRIGPLHCYVGKQRSPQNNLSVVVRPENVELIELDSSQARAPRLNNCFRGVVRKKVYLGEINEFTVIVEDGKAEITARVSPSRSISVGQQVILHLPPEKTIVVQ